MNDENKIIIECLNTFGRVPEQWELLKMIKQLQSNWNSLREWLEDKQNLVCGCGITPEYIYAYEDVLDKMDELESSDNK